ncbi:MAG: hypothetical protein OXF01_01760 [Gemmatimonadetes bacterium]|nr:hypothetical protein [Gemmatimonadota bacterium]
MDITRTIACTLLAVAAAAPAPAIAQDRPLTADFPEVYRAGGLNGPDWAQFTNPSRMGFDAAGNLYVLDRSAFQVVVIGPGGDFMITAGREGGGPGEFRNPTDLLVWRDGRFGVVDIEHGAYQLFGPRGELERFVRMSSTAGEAGMAAVRNRLRPDPSGGAVFAEGAGIGASLFAAMTETRGGDVVDVGGEFGKLERIDLTGEAAVAETLARARRIPPDDPDRDRPHFAPPVYWDLLPDRTIAYVDSTAYEITLLGADGQARGVLTRPIPPETVTARIRTAVREHLLEELDEEGLGALNEKPEFMSEDMWRQMTEQMTAQQRERIESQEYFPEIPVVRGLRATWDGSLWVQRRGADPWDYEGPIDVLGPNGEYRGTFAAGELEMPRAFGPNGLVAYVEMDEMDVPTIVVKRLPRVVR